MVRRMWCAPRRQRGLVNLKGLSGGQFALQDPAPFSFTKSLLRQFAVGKGRGRQEVSVRRKSRCVRSRQKSREKDAHFTSRDHHVRLGK